jgi:pimeloyl-ACP methyl ester carboxylesterase
MEPPVVDYARSGEVSIAYQVIGDGPTDLVFVPLLISTIFSRPHEPFATFYEGLASFSRLFLFDKRGIGASDRPRTPPTLEVQMDDVRAVLDAVGSEQAALFGAGHGGLMCALFAATYPERTSALVLYNAWPRFPGTPEEHRQLIRREREEMGRAETIERMVREQYASLADDESFLSVAATIVRSSTSPGAAAEFMRTVVEADISEVLPIIRAPTLALYRRDAFVPKAYSSSLRETQRRRHGPSPRPFHMRGWSASQGRTSLRSRARKSRSRSSGSCALLSPSRSQIVCSQPSSSRTSSVRPSVPPHSEIAPGATCSPPTTHRCGASSGASAGPNWIRPATASSPASTARPAVSPAQRPWLQRRRSRDWTFAPVFIRASASAKARSSRASQFTSAHESPRSRNHERCSCREQ